MPFAADGLNGLRLAAILVPMRVIAGEFRGRSLVAPSGQTTRPILDRVKVALFDWLGSRLALPGSLPPVAVLDIFSGGGSLGIEALSRGAASCVFIESEKSALQCLRSNIETLHLGDRVQVLSESADQARPTPTTHDAFGLVFLDPPYRLSEDVSPNSVMGRLIERLGAAIPVTDGASVLWRQDAAVQLPADLPGGWISMERRVWGTMAVVLLQQKEQDL